jgi:hypothetical protein
MHRSEARIESPDNEFLRRACDQLDMSSAVRRWNGAEKAHDVWL